MDVDELFLRKCIDLESRMSSSDEYIVLGAAVLIRQLFLDGSKSLVDLVNRTRRLRLQFEIVDTARLLEAFSELPALEFLGIQDALDPGVIPNPPVRVVGRDEFFRTIAQLSSGKASTVKDIVLHQANAMGGVHAGAFAGKPRNEDEAALTSVEASLRLGELAPGLRQMKAIGRVVLKAIVELRMLVACDMAVRSPAERVAGYFNRGTVYAKLGKLREAIADFDKAIELDPAHPNIADAYYSRGHTFLRLALLDLEEYARIAPDSPEHQQVVEALQSLGSDTEHTGEGG